MSLNQLDQSAGNHDADVILVNQNQDITLGLQQTSRRMNSDRESPIGFSQNYSIQHQLRNISRQVAKIAEKGKHMMQTTLINAPVSSYHENINNFSQSFTSNPLLNSKHNELQLGKYNYYGHKYRHQADKIQQKQRIAKDFHQTDDLQLKSTRPETKSKNPKKDNLDMPVTQSYYIYFQDQKQNKEKELQVKLDRLEAKKINQSKTVFNNSSNQNKFSRLNIKKQQRCQEDDQLDQGRTPPVQHFSKQQPEARWILQKKVKKLQKQLNGLKKRQQKRQNTKNFAYNQPKKDSRVQVSKQVQNLINSLWP